MDCQPCNNNSVPITLQSFNSTYNSNCGCSEGDCGCNGVTMDSKCIFYTGPNLPCSQITTNQDLETALLKIDQKLCTTLGNYAVYNKGCLDAEGTLTTEQEFVEAISDYVCTLRADFTTFTDTTFGGYQDDIDTRFDALENPNLTCSAVGITSADSLSDVYGKYCLAFQDIYSQLDVSGVSWDSCYTVEPDPDTIEEAFNIVLAQICDLKNSIDFSGEGILPTFNNQGSCLPGTLTATDSLVDTVEKIKERLCETPTFDVNELTWGCVSKPNNIATDLQSAFDSVLSTLTTLKQNLPTFSGDFVVTQTNVSDPCDGKTVELAATSILDKFVAVDNSDSSPGTLIQKLEAGTNLSFDTATTPGKLIINSTGGAATDQYVKLNVSDPAAGYLIDKLEGATSSDGIDIVVTEDNVDHKANIAVSIDFEALWDSLLTFLDSNPESKAAFCQRVQSCLPDCIVPPNVTVIYSDTDSTTTTTTTTSGGA